MPYLALRGGTPVRVKPFTSWPIYSEEEERHLKEVLYKSNWGIGVRVGKITEFEKRFAEYHGVAFGVCCANCSLALEVMLKSAGVGIGDEVIVPSYTFIATATSVVQCGAVPVFADIDPETYLIKVEEIKALINSKTKAIIPVYFAGSIPDMVKINEICRPCDIAVIEDAAQAHGAKWGGRFAGNFGLGAGFSFQYSKNMTANEGGIILTNNAEFLESCRTKIWHGRKKDGLWYEHFQLGSNYRLTEFQAAILLAQLSRLKEQTERRVRNAFLLDEGIKNIKGFFYIKVPPKQEIHSRHLYIIRIDSNYFSGISKEIIIKALNAEGLPAYSGYGLPLYKNPVFREKKFGIFSNLEYWKNYDFEKVITPNAEQTCKESIWLMHQVLLGEEADMHDILKILKKISDNREELLKC